MLALFFYQMTFNAKLDSNKKRQKKNRPNRTLIKLDPKRETKKNKKKKYMETILNNENKEDVT